MAAACHLYCHLSATLSTSKRARLDLIGTETVTGFSFEPKSGSQTASDTVLVWICHFNVTWVLHGALSSPRSGVCCMR